ncbi:MAG: biotin-dependent carboxyltransferase family protein [Acidobacteria bacterium]|nr:biotin-dependent carboxyltransferase family protein [Acidobacteriota bacterium]
MGLLLRKEGIFTSLQDLGRFGRRRFGVPPGGAMDRTAARITNLLVGNDEADAVLEIHFPGPEIVFESDCVFAIGGGDLDAQLNGRPLANWSTFVGRKADVLQFARKRSGSRSYLSAAGGFAIEPAPFAFCTNRLPSATRLEFRAALCNTLDLSTQAVSNTIRPAYSKFPTVRIIAGAEFALLHDEDKAALESAAFTLTQNSDRMGFRLQGRALTMAASPELVSAAVDFGTIQLLPDGQLVVLMADHQVTGGYPRLGHIITADLPLAAQLGPGDGIGFKLVEIGEAERVAAQFEQDLNWLKTGLRFGRYW